MRREAWLAEKRAEIEGLTGLRLTEVSPSRRDFTLFVATQRRGIALIPRLKRCDPDTGGEWPGRDLVAAARSCDEADAAAVAVSTASRNAGSMEDLRRVASAVTAPVLRDDLCLHPNQLYDSRLHGADAVILPAGGLGAGEIADLAATARSLHMAPVIEVTAAEELDAALRRAPACIGLRIVGADGVTDVHRTRAMAENIPRQRIVVLLSEVRRLTDLAPLEGGIDAAVVGDALLDADDIGAAVADFVARQPA